MASYLEQAKQLIRKLRSYRVKHNKRSEKKSVGTLSKLAANNFEHLEKEVRVYTLAEPLVPLRHLRHTESKRIMDDSHQGIPCGRPFATRKSGGSKDMTQNVAISYERGDPIHEIIFRSTTTLRKLIT